MSSYLSHRVIQSSPSVSLERGSYRIRALSRPPKPLFQQISKRPDTYHSRQDSRATARMFVSKEKKLVLVVMLLMFAAVSCFGTAYYLFTTSRWATTLVFRSQHSLDDHKVDTHYDPDYPETIETAVGERYLSYLPHSGFHNQRIALENALVLSRLLNRTLLVPPIRLGRRAISHENFTRLQLIVGDEFLPPTCDEGYRRDVVFGKGCVLTDSTRVHTFVPWGWLTDFDKIRSEFMVYERWNLSREWVISDLKISDSETFTISDTTLYDYQITEDGIGMQTIGSSEYLRSVTISSLQNNPARLLQFGSLFGSRRLRVHSEQAGGVRTQVKSQMAFTELTLDEVSNEIHDELGGTYLGAHIRLNDWFFQRRSDYNARLIWWKIVHGLLNVTVDDALQLESKYARYTIEDDPPLEAIPKRKPLTLAIGEHSLTCHGELHTRAELLLLNTPLFISTDVRSPRKNRHLSAFHHTFPCTFFLEDFSASLGQLKELRNARDGVALGSLMAPFVDAMVAAKATAVVGTGHSTFSWFVQDVLWRRYHGMEIKERGK